MPPGIKCTLCKLNLELNREAKEREALEKGLSNNKNLMELLLRRLAETQVVEGHEEIQGLSTHPDHSPLLIRADAKKTRAV